MEQSKAESIVLISATIVGGGYLYRRVSEGEPREERYSRAGSTPFRLLGQGELLPTGKFVTGFGVSFIAIAALASIAPELGASLAGLVAAGSFFYNGQSVARDVKIGLGRGPNRGKLSELPEATGLSSQLGHLEGINLSASLAGAQVPVAQQPLRGTINLRGLTGSYNPNPGNGKLNGLSGSVAAGVL